MPAEAVAYLQKALEVYPEGDGAYAQLGGVLITWGQNYKDAMALLDKAIQLSAVNEFARDYMGVALLNQGQYDQAIKYFQEALRINPDLQSAKQHLELALHAKNP
jgi:tetratricopeptide (TPR) repeat protein